MIYYTATEWFREQYKDRWDDCPYFQDMVRNGEIPASYIGRRTVMVNNGMGCQLLTEGFHFMVDDEEGRKYLHDMTMTELCEASTHNCKKWGENPYCEELCRRTGNLEAYRKDPEEATKAAAKGCGVMLI